MIARKELCKLFLAIFIKPLTRTSYKLRHWKTFKESENVMKLNIANFTYGFLWIIGNAEIVKAMQFYIQNKNAFRFLKCVCCNRFHDTELNIGPMNQALKNAGPRTNCPQNLVNACKMFRPNGPNRTWKY